VLMMWGGGGGGVGAMTVLIADGEDSRE